MKKEHYYGTLKIVDRAFNTEVEGSGLFFPDDGKVYVRLQKSDNWRDNIKRVQYGSRIIFETEQGKTFVSLGTLLGYDDVTDWFNGTERVVTLDEYAECASIKAARQITTEGIKNLDITIRAASSTISNMGTPTQIQAKRAAIMVSNHQAYDGSSGSQKDFIAINITSEEHIPLDGYRRFVRPIEIYWRLYTSNLKLEIDGIFGSVKTDDQKMETFKIKSQETFYSADKNYASYLNIQRDKIDIEKLYALINEYFDRASENAFPKIPYAIESYHKVMVGAKITDAVTYLATAFDSFANGSANSKKRAKLAKEKIIQDIKKVQSTIENDTTLNQEVIDFYCRKKPEDIYENISSRTFFQNIDLLCKEIDYVLKDDEKESLRRLFNARKQIIHGQDYKQDNILNRSLSRTKVCIHESGDGYSVGQEDGYIFTCSMLFEKMLKAYLEKQKSKH